MTETLLWSLEEAARQLGGISTRTVRRLLHVGEIEPRRVGKRLLVCAASVHSYVERLGSEAQNQQGGMCGRKAHALQAQRFSRLVGVFHRAKRQEN